MRTLGFADFTEFATCAMAGHRPYPYQRRLAGQGLPDLLRAPPGTGKTAAAVLAWLWRRMRFPSSVHDRLVYVLPLRSMVEQTGGQITAWLERLGLAATVPVVTLAGGESAGGDDWRGYPRQPAILLGTQDMVISRLLMRGYGERRESWPVTFGLLHSSAQFVFDDAALFGPALRTSLQLQAMREAFGTAGSTATMWMSATAAATGLRSPDHGPPVHVVELGPDDRADERLARRLAATRTVRRAAVPADPALYPAALARALAGWHIPGTATIAVVNTAERAVAVYDELEKAAHAAELLLLHACFRPQERYLTAALARSPVPRAGRIVVTTQVLEAGLDISCQTMFTELAPWPSIVQRAGRCNRAGERPGALLRWAQPPGGGAAAGYDEAGLAAAGAALRALDGAAVTSSDLSQRQVRAERRESPAPGPLVPPALGGDDLLRLFDTAPADLGGAEIDVTPWVGDGGEPNALVAWRFWPDGEPAAAEPAPGGDELCPAPVASLRRGATAYWVWDEIDGRWRRCGEADIRPGVILLADAAAGGYSPVRGWSPGSRAPVPPAGAGTAGRRASLEAIAGPGPDALNRDPGSFTGTWVDLPTHLADTEREFRALAGDWRFGLGADGAPAGPATAAWPAGFTPGQWEAGALAARFHDLGKASRHFQEFLRGNAPGGAPAGGPWAKSAGRGGRRRSRPYLRHELVTVLALLHPQCHLLDGVAEPDLVVYLAAAHHGKVRLRVAPLRAESRHDPPAVLGARDGDKLPGMNLGGGAGIRALTLDTRVLGVAGGGRAGGGDHMAWTARVTALRDRPGLGPFRLAFLEALVRIADWRASRAPSDSTLPDGGTAAS